MALTDTYGDVTGEYLALRRHAGLVTGQHELVWGSGPDAVPFLQDILSQEVASLDDGGVARSLLLSPRGKLRALLWVLRGAGQVGMFCDVGSSDVVVSDLERLRIRVEVELRRDERPITEIWGPEAPRVLEQAGLPVPAGWVEKDEAVVALLPLGPLPRYAVAGVGSTRLESGGARPVGQLAVTAVRIEAGEPVMGRDVDERTIPQEADLVAEAISLEKGCYLGHELVARIESRGHVNRHLRGVALHENVVPPQGAEVLMGAETVGSLTSVAESLTLRAPVGLALLHRKVGAGDAVSVRWESGEASGTARELPLDDFTLS
ncbi:MAG: YgfZ/GcvT domain-containing protein [Acidimicrobiia bacterium]